MKLKRLSDNGDVVRLEAVDPVINGDPTPDFSQMADLLDQRGYAGKAVLSLDDTEFIDSSGLSWLLECHGKFNRAGGKLAIHSIPPTVGDTLKMMRLELVLNLANDENAALECVRGDCP
jgi:anti-anti-sigma factor